MILKIWVAYFCNLLEGKFFQSNLEFGGVLSLNFIGNRKFNNLLTSQFFLKPLFFLFFVPHCFFFFLFSFRSVSVSLSGCWNNHCKLLRILKNCKLFHSRSWTISYISIILISKLQTMWLDSVSKN